MQATPHVCNPSEVLHLRHLDTAEIFARLDLFTDNDFRS
jgi:hypothetical protein